VATIINRSRERRMKVSREQMALNRARILAEAGRLFRERGFDAVTVAEVMQATGQTHGGFYGHFASKDALVAAVVAHAMAAPTGLGAAPTGGRAATTGGDATEAGAGAQVLERWIDRYLSPAHRDAPGSGCPTAGLAGMMRHQTATAQAAMAEGIEAQVARLARALPGADREEDGDGDVNGDTAAWRRAAIGRWSAMVGAVMLARAVGDAPLGDELLAETRAWLRDVKEVAA
jgi:TetR/AcrR family transcriptional repressor of nem operon